jgi:hypothetical protein
LASNGIAASQSSRLHSFWQSESGARPRTADDDKGSKNFKPGAAFVEPEVRSSANGELNTTLRMQYAYKNIGGYRLYVRTYEGAVPGPTLRLKPGDVLHIKLINDMPPNRDPEPIDHSLPHQFNTTNFHSHGLHVSPSGISDNVMRMMEPGESYDIEIAIPSDRIPGTNWYHPHAHGSADVQIASGAVGALIIEGDFAEIPEIAAAKERLLVLTEAMFDSFGMVEDFGTLFPETARALPSREWREGTDHHHAARRGAALAHSARGLAGRSLHGLGRAYAQSDRSRRHSAVAHGPNRTSQA